MIDKNARLVRIGLVLAVAVICHVGVACQGNISCQSNEETVPVNQVTLRVFNWDEYLAPDTLKKFTDRTGIRVELSTFEDEDVLVSRVKSNPAAFDVIFPSRDRICRLLSLKLLAPIQKEMLSNLHNIEEKYTTLPCDPAGEYSLPYLMGTTGIAYDVRAFPQGVTSWRQLIDPKWGQRAALLNNADEVLSIALMLMGKSINMVDGESIEKAGDILRPMTKTMRGFLDPIRMRDLLAAGELAIAQIYSGDAVYAGRRNPNIRYVIPEEGCVMWVDMMAIPAESKYKNEALLFIDFMLEPEINAACAAYTGYSTPNAEARKLLPSSIIDDLAVNTPDEQLGRCAFFDIQEESLGVRNRVWEILKKQQ